MNSSELIVETRPVGPLQCNCTILGDPESRKAIIVDPGGDAEVLLQRLVDLNLQVERIIHTHAHLDHFLASGKMKEATGANLALHKDDFFYGISWRINAGCLEYLMSLLLPRINGWSMKRK